MRAQFFRHCQKLKIVYLIIFQFQLFEQSQSYRQSHLLWLRLSTLMASISFWCRLEFLSTITATWWVCNNTTCQAPPYYHLKFLSSNNTFWETIALLLSLYRFGLLS
jgi:hypothetical protein